MFLTFNQLKSNMKDTYLEQYKHWGKCFGKGITIIKQLQIPHHQIFQTMTDGASERAYLDHQNSGELCYDSRCYLQISIIGINDYIKESDYK